MTRTAVGARALARRFLQQTLAAESDVLLLERRTRADVIEALGRASAAGPVPEILDRSPSTGLGTPSVPAASERDRVATVRAGSRQEVTDALIEGATDLGTLSRLVAGCSRCGLYEVRKKAVFGEGASDARAVCVGEAPGAREDESGRPFVGRAGQLLDRLLQSIGLPRESVYICNVLKSRPPGNRDPLPEEVAACSPYLLRQLALIQPEVIVAFGAFAARTLLDTRSALGRLRGRLHRYAGYPVIVTYHPAALLRNPGWIRPTWEDLQMVRRLLDGVSDDGETPFG